MFAAAIISFFALSAVAPSASAMPSGGLIRNVHRHVPSQFEERGYTQDADLLEDYETYSARYQLFDCEDSHNTTFWDNCCHPLLKTETIDDLPDMCVAPCDETTTSSVPPQTSTADPTTTSVAHTEPTTTTKPVTTTSVADKPETTSSKEPTTTEAPATTTQKTTSAPQTTSTSSGGGSGWTEGGFGTYFYQEGNYGACGQKHSDDDLIVAIDYRKYGDASQVSSWCGKKLEIVNLDNGNTVNAIVADDCPSCSNSGCLDMSLGTFKALESDLSVGEFRIKYRVIG